MPIDLNNNTRGNQINPSDKYQIEFTSHSFLRRIKKKLYAKQEISHRSFLLECFAHNQGLTFCQYFRKPVHILWTDIECIDLAGLKSRETLKKLNLPSVNKFLKMTSDFRFFELMSSNTNLLQMCAGAKNPSLIASNVLAISLIQPSSVHHLQSLLERHAIVNKIKLQSIIICD